MLPPRPYWLGMLEQSRAITWAHGDLGVSRAPIARSTVEIYVDADDYLPYEVKKHLRDRQATAFLDGSLRETGIEETQRGN